MYSVNYLNYKNNYKALEEQKEKLDKEVEPFEIEINELEEQINNLQSKRKYVPSGVDEIDESIEVEKEEEARKTTTNIGIRRRIQRGNSTII